MPVCPAEYKQAFSVWMWRVDVIIRKLSFQYPCSSIKAWLISVPDSCHVCMCGCSCVHGWMCVHVFMCACLLSISYHVCMCTCMYMCAAAVCTCVQLPSVHVQLPSVHVIRLAWNSRLYMTVEAG